jgi:LPS-assembly protein
MRFSRHLALTALMLLGSATLTRAEELMGDMGAFASGKADAGATTMDAQRLEVYLDREMRAFGDAEIHSDGQIIKGDRIDFNPINRELHATGNVRLEQANTVVEGSELRLKTEDHEGEMTEPVFHMGVDGSRKSRGSAKTLFFEGPTKERLKSARYTTCEDGRDDWYLRTGELEINHHTESATATNASIEFKGIPILYTPWIDFPFNNQRQSGLLSPVFGTTTRSGFELSTPYYWNIAPNRDATITPRYLSKRGLQTQAEFRYLEPDYNGTDVVEYLPSDDQTGKNRFFVDIKHNQTFGNGWSGNVQFSRVSDDNYFSDLSSHVIVTSRVNLPQQANLRYDSDDWHFSSLVQQYQTLDKLSYPYQRLPQLTLTGLQEVGPVDASLNSEFVRFEKNSNAPSTVTGNRFTAYPSLSLPLTQSYGYITPKIGVHYTKYDLSNAGTAYDSDTRTLPIFSLDSGLYFERDMRVIKNLYTQTLEPRVYYVYIPSHDQSRLPIFDTGLSDINLATIFTENQFSGGDRINDANQITLGLTSRLIDQKSGTQRLAATVAQRFYFSDQNVVMPGGIVRTGMHSDIFTALSLNLINHWYADAAWQYNTDNGITEKGNISTRYNPEPGKVLNMAYRFTRNSLEQVDVSSEWPLGGNWYGLGRLNYSLRNHPPADRRGPAEYLAGVEYNAGCWIGRAVLHRLSTASATANYAFFFQLELGGLSSIGTNPLDVLKRSISGYTNSALIPEPAK